MEKETINIIMASDDNYAQPLGVAIYSLLKNFKSEKYKVLITVLDGNISEQNKNKINKIINDFKSEIVFKKISNKDFNGFPIKHHFSVVIYYRLIIPNLFKDNVKKVIYLDCDTLILGNVAELYDANISDYYIGAIKDITSEQILKNERWFYKKIKEVFNSGVLVMNLEKMRLDNFMQKALEFVRDNSEELLLPDQDALNFLCVDMWLKLDNTWNYQMDRSQKKVIPDPKILHYTTSYKPWHKFYHNYYQKDYKKYMRVSWPDYRTKSVPFNIAIKQLIKYVPFSVFIVRIIKKYFN